MRNEFFQNRKRKGNKEVKLEAHGVLCQVGTDKIETFRKIPTPLMASIPLAHLLFILKKMHVCIQIHIHMHTHFQMGMLSLWMTEMPTSVHQVLCLPVDTEERTASGSVLDPRHKLGQLKRYKKWKKYSLNIHSPFFF